MLFSVFYWSCLVLEKLGGTFCAGLEWQDGNKIWIYPAKGSCRSSIRAFPTPFLPSAFRQQVSREVWWIFWEHCSTSCPLWTPRHHPHLPISYLHKRFLLSCHPCLVFFPQPPTVRILFHRTWPLPVPLFTTLTRTRAHASCPHSKSSRAISYRREQKWSSLSYRPTLVRCGMKQPLLFETESVSCFKVLILELKHTRCR